MKTAKDCIIGVDHLGRITDWNPAAEATFGWKKEDALGKSLVETIIAPEHRSEHLAAITEPLGHSDDSREDEWIRVTATDADGQTFSIEFAIAPALPGAEQISTVRFRDVPKLTDVEQTIKLQSTALIAAANGIFITDTDGIIVWANPALLKITGYSLEEVIGQSTRLFRSGRQGQIFYQSLWQTIQKGEVWKGEIVNRHKDGSLYPQEMTITPVMDDNGTITNFVAINQDISERVHMQEELSRIQSRQQVINYFATSLSGANTIEEILWDITHNCISELGWEDAVVYLFNEDRTSLVQRAAFGTGKEKDHQVLDPIEIPLGQGIVGTVARTGASEIVADVSKDPRYIVDDKIRGSEVAAAIIYEDQVIGVIDSEHSQKNFYQDYDLEILDAISSLAANKIMRRISMKKTEESEFKYRTIFEGMQDIYAEVDYFSGAVIEASHSILAVSGYSREEVLGKQFDKFLVSPGHLHEFMEEISQKGSVHDFELSLLNKSGDPVPLSFTASLIKDEAGNSIKVVGIARDISARKQVELSLRESARMKTNFVANVSHELRTPMASIMGFASTIMHDKNMDEGTREEFINIIYTEGQRLTRLITNILDISRMESGANKIDLYPNIIKQSIDEAIDAQSIIAAQRSIAIKKSLDDDLPSIMCSPDSIRQLAANLIGNAIKFTDAGGSIAVRLQHVGENLVLAVKDTGLGIPEADLNNIFEKFYRVDRGPLQYEGTGIGLTIVKDIVDQHQAEISVESEMGKGTTFRISFPVHGELATHR